MELLKMQQLVNQLERKLFLFFIAFSSTQIICLDSRLVFSIPLLCLSFVSGKIEVICALLGILLGSVLLQNYILLIVSGLFVILLAMMMPIYSIKTRTIAYISAIYLLLVEVLFLDSPINTAVMKMVVSLFFGIVCLKNASVFIHKKDNLQLGEIYFIGLLCFVVILPFYQLSPVFLMIWIRLLLLIVLYIASFHTSYELAVTMSFVLLIMDQSLIGEIMILLIPFSFLHLIKTSTKLAIGTVYVLSHLVVPFLTDTSVYPYVLEVIFSGVSFMMIPSSVQLLCEKQVDENKSRMQLVSGQRKLVRQLENYSDLFFRIARSFNDTQLNTSVIGYIGAVEEALCDKCINAKDCFNKQKGDHRLVKLLKKGIIEGLNREEQHYVECYCLHMAQYKKLMNEQHKLYQHQKEMNEEYQVLKHHLYDQLSLVGELLKNYAANVQWSDQYNEDNMKDLLEAYHYKIWYIHKENLSLQTFSLEIGMTEITKKEVYDVIIPVLEKYLDTKLTVIKMENNANQLGYTQLILSNHHHFDLVYGLQQISKDRDNCGDSYLAFRHHSNTIIALSDGMGYGRKAHEESDLTLDVFSRLLKSGIALDDCVQTINALLKIKNRIEMFTTLDIIMFDTNIGEARFIKNGAMPSYIYRNSELIKIEPKALPIGIVQDIHTYQEKMTLEMDDILIMYSDGFDIGIEPVIERVLQANFKQVPQFIADTIMNELVFSEQVDDDATIIVMKVKRIN